MTLCRLRECGYWFLRGAGTPYIWYMFGLVANPLVRPALFFQDDTISQALLLCIAHTDFSLLPVTVGTSLIPATVIPSTISTVAPVGMTSTLWTTATR